MTLPHRFARCAAAVVLTATTALAGLGHSAAFAQAVDCVAPEVPYNNECVVPGQTCDSDSDGVKDGVMYVDPADGMEKCGTFADKCAALGHTNLQDLNSVLPPFCRLVKAQHRNAQSETSTTSTCDYRSGNINFARMFSGRTLMFRRRIPTGRAARRR